MIRRTRRGDIITRHRVHSTKPWFHFPVATLMERITVATAPVVSMDGQPYERCRRASPITAGKSICADGPVRM